MHILVDMRVREHTESTGYSIQDIVLRSAL